MTDIDNLLSKLRAEKTECLSNADNLSARASAEIAKAEVFAARIQGIEEGRDLTLAATQPTQDDTVKAETNPAPSEQPRRERRDIRGLVYAAIAELNLGITQDDLIENLGAAKSSVVSALAYHEANDAVRRSENGTWFVPRPAQSNGDDSDQDDTQAEPQSVVDVIRAAGEGGITDKELAARGYAFVSVVKAKNAGEVEIRDGRIYAVDT